MALGSKNKIFMKCLLRVLDYIAEFLKMGLLPNVSVNAERFGIYFVTQQCTNIFLQGPSNACFSSYGIDYLWLTQSPHFSDCI